MMVRDLWPQLLLGMALGAVGMFLVRMSPIDELFIVGHLLLVGLLSVLGVALGLRGKAKLGAMLGALMFGMVGMFDFSAYLLKQRLLHCAVALSEERIPPLALACPAAEVGEPNSRGIRLVTFSSPWLFEVVLIPDGIDGECGDGVTRKGEHGRLCLQHR